MKSQYGLVSELKSEIHGGLIPKRKIDPDQAELLEYLINRVAEGVGKVLYKQLQTIDARLNRLEGR